MIRYVVAAVLAVFWIYLGSNMQDIRSHNAHQIFIPLTLITLPVVFMCVLPIYRREQAAKQARDKEAEEARRQREEEAEQQRIEQDRQTAREHAQNTMPPVPSMTANVRVNQNFVRLVVALSETERAAVERYGLSRMVLESRPKWAPDEIESMVRGAADRFRAQGYTDLSESLRELRHDWTSARENTTLGDFLDPLFERYFDDVGDAMRYADKLKKEILPQIKAIIYRSMEHGETGETFQV